MKPAFRNFFNAGLGLALIFSPGCKTEKMESGPDAQERLRLFSSSPEEQLKPTIWFTGDTTITNEDRLDLFQEHIKDVGGAYIGVGSSQNLSLAAWAKSEYIWLMDFTEIVVAANKINIAFLKQAKTRAEFRTLWEKKAREQALQIIENAYQKEKDLAFIKQAWSKSQPFQQKRFQNDDIVTEKYKFSLWLYDDALYNHIRNLAITDRIRALKGDLRGSATVDGMAKAARQMQIKVRLIYFSNAEEYFIYGDQFRKNWLAIPVDEKSVIVRTISVQKHQFPWAPDSHLSTDRGFHYNIQPALNYQAWLRSAKKDLRSRDILKQGQTDRERGFTMIPASALPETAGKQH